MKARFSELSGIDHAEPISEEANYEFFFNLEKTLLLALKERGTLNISQWHYAQEELNSRRRERARRLLEESEQ